LGFLFVQGAPRVHHTHMECRSLGAVVASTARVPTSVVMSWLTSFYWSSKELTEGEEDDLPPDLDPISF
jgi:hypothetical protein